MTPEPTVENGEMGEIAVRYEDDPVRFKEHWDEPDRTERTVQTGWLLTGDLGSRDADGCFTFESRNDDVIISAGYRIGPAEIEENPRRPRGGRRRRRHRGPGRGTGRGAEGVRRARNGQGESDGLAGDLQGHVKERLAACEHPRDVEFVEGPPETETGKVRRARLREREGLRERA